MTTLPRDSDNAPIPALRLRPNGAHAISATTGASARNVTPFHDTTRIVSLYATGAVYVQFGDATVTSDANAHYFPSGLLYDFAIGGDKTLHTPYVSVLAMDSDCNVYISEKQ